MSKRITYYLAHDLWPHELPILEAFTAATENLPSCAVYVPKRNLRQNVDVAERNRRALEDCDFVIAVRTHGKAQRSFVDEIKGAMSLNKPLVNLMETAHAMITPEALTEKATIYFTRGKAAEWKTLEASAELSCMGLEVPDLLVRGAEHLVSIFLNMLALA